eukprot:scaffold2119_cov67-Phaeocystis_antarctica.AAC.5
MEQGELAIGDHTHTATYRFSPGLNCVQLASKNAHSPVKDRDTTLSLTPLSSDPTLDSSPIRLQDTTCSAGSGERKSRLSVLVDEMGRGEVALPPLLGERGPPLRLRRVLCARE